MIFQAKEKYDIDLNSSCMIGDSVKDIECAKKAGCNLSILVQTGNGKKAEDLLAARDVIPDFVAENLFTAAQGLIMTVKLNSG